ncbi:MAG: hypothetical protein HYV75_01635 [Opitutae bacterium]|nr:hypothetical protein [Opitutae bacterium]
MLIVTGKARSLPEIVQRRLTALGMQPQPLFTYRNHSDIYLNKQLLHQALAVLRGAAFADVDLPAMSPLLAGAQQFDWHRDRAAFLALAPFPVRYDTPYGAPPWLEYEGVPIFIAHAPTTLEFNVPAGARHLTLVFGMIADAYLRHSSDGAGIIVELTDPAGRTREIWQRQLNPRKQPEDRLRLTATIPLPVPFDGRLIVRTDPGPNRNIDYDWVYFSEITIR